MPKILRDPKHSPPKKSEMKKYPQISISFSYVSKSLCAHSHKVAHMLGCSFACSPRSRSLSLSLLHTQSDTQFPGGSCKYTNILTAVEEENSPTHKIRPYNFTSLTSREQRNRYVVKRGICFLLGYYIIDEVLCCY